MEYSVDRIHDVLEGRICGRGCGKTFARLHQVAGFIELGERLIVVQISLYEDIRYLLPMFEKVLFQHGLKIDRKKNNEVRVGDSLVRFIPEFDFTRRTSGLEFVQVDARHQD